MRRLDARIFGLIDGCARNDWENDPGNDWKNDWANDSKLVTKLTAGCSGSWRAEQDGSRGRTRHCQHQ